MMTSSRIKFTCFIGWILSVAIMVFIFLSSSQVADVSSQTSGGVISAVLQLVLDNFDQMSEVAQDDLIASFQYLFRKSAHFLIYFALGASLTTAIYTYNIKTALKIILPALISLIYAASDEFHQTFVAGRGGRISDVLLDFSGSVTAILLISLCIYIYDRVKSRRLRKMRKKELMNKLGELVSTVEKLSSQVKELKSENAELKAEIESLSALPGEPVEDVVAEETSTYVEPVGFTVKVVDEVELSDEGSDEPKLSNESLEYGAGVIGRITVESAKYCDKVTAAGGNDVKDLLGLIMGKSEVCKNEILSIAMSELAFETKQEMIDAQLNEAVEYFKSVSEQTV